MPTTTFYTTPSDILELISELNSYESIHRMLLTPHAGPCGRAAKMLLDLDRDRWLAKDDLARANLEIGRLQVACGRMPTVNEIVEIGDKNNLAARSALDGDQNTSEPPVWKTSTVAYLWHVGTHDRPGFSVIGSSFIHTADGFGTTWRFPVK